MNTLTFNNYLKTTIFTVKLLRFFKKLLRKIEVSCIGKIKYSLKQVRKKKLCNSK